MSIIRLIFSISAITFLCMPPSFATTFSWTPSNTDIVVNVNSLQLTVDGITVTAQAYTAEINAAGDDAVVLGPWPTQSGANNPGVGIDVRGLGSEQLGLIADSSVGIPANGTDYFSGGLSPGFSSGYGNDTVADPAPPAFHFALFSFDQAVDIPGVTVDDVTNQDRDIWMGASTIAPDFSSGFLTGIAGFDIVNSPDDAGDGLFTHSLPAVATGVSYFLVGAPPQGEDLGPISGTGSFSGSNIFIDSFNGTTTVPIPAAAWLFVSGLLGLIGISRRMKAA